MLQPSVVDLFGVFPAQPTRLRPPRDPPLGVTIGSRAKRQASRLPELVLSPGPGPTSARPRPVRRILRWWDTGNTGSMGIGIVEKRQVSRGRWTWWTDFRPPSDPMASLRRARRGSNTGASRPLSGTPWPGRFRTNAPARPGHEQGTVHTVGPWVHLAGFFEGVGSVCPTEGRPCAISSVTSTPGGLNDVQLEVRFAAQTSPQVGGRCATWSVTSCTKSRWLATQARRGAERVAGGWRWWFSCAR